MDPMMSALKARRGGAQGPQAAAPQPTGLSIDSEQGSPVAGILESLTPEQKMELMELLTVEMSEGEETDPKAIEKGAPSSQEKAMIKGEAAEANDVIEEDESDAIQASMVDAGSKRKADAGAKPSGLGDRAKIYAVNKLKGKGKI